MHNGMRQLSRVGIGRGTRRGLPGVKTTVAIVLAAQLALLSLLGLSLTALRDLQVLETAGQYRHSIIHSRGGTNGLDQRMRRHGISRGVHRSKAC